MNITLRFERGYGTSNIDLRAIKAMAMSHVDDATATILISATTVELSLLTTSATGRRIMEALAHVAPERT